MDILNNKWESGKTSKPEMEQLERQKHEYKLLGTYLRRKGLKMYAYNSRGNELTEVNIKTKDAIDLVPDEDGKLLPVDLGLEEAKVDSRDTHFEALNWKNAQKRLRKFKDGKIKELCNLRKPNPDGIKFY